MLSPSPKTSAAMTRLKKENFWPCKTELIIPLIIPSIDLLVQGRKGLYITEPSEFHESLLYENENAQNSSQDPIPQKSIKMP